MGLLSQRSLAFAFLLFVLHATIGAQESATSGARIRKQMTATQVPNGAIDVDGRLNEAVWKNARFVADFQQALPIEFAEPEDRTEVAILYDDDAIYVGAIMYVKNPDSLRKDLSRRDDRGLGEQMIVSLDSYLDRRTAYGFGVTTAGVQFDRYAASDNQNWDFSWNAVWEVSTSVTEDAWIAEFRIPFSQLRFNNTEVQTWGVNFNRWRPFTNEDIFWVVVPATESGFASRFGNLVGIEGVKPSRRLELLPYVATDGRFNNNHIAGDPYDDGSTFSGRAGGDLKMGLGPNLTLNATFNPDFGQVEADPAEVNLSAYETHFSEKRPFFTEGSDLFSSIGPTYFYSRRIGGQPHGGVDGHFVDYPENSTILGAAKVTGRLQSGTSIGGLIALTDNEEAKVYDTTLDVESKIKVEPSTQYGVVRVQQELGDGGSSAGVILTGLNRSINDDDPLARSLVKNAYSGGFDYDLKFSDRAYTLYGHAGFSHISGSEEAILLKQLSSAHYYQRPDASHVEVDSTRTSLTGYTGGIALEKSGGEHWVGDIGMVFDTPGLDVNDAGIMGAPDDIESWIAVDYRETKPGNHFRRYDFSFDAYAEWNFDGVRQSSDIELGVDVTWLNYWSNSIDFNYHFGGLDDGMTRGGPLMKAPDSWSASGSVSSNWNAVTTYGLSSHYAHNELGGYGFNLSLNASTRIGERVRFSIASGWDLSESRRQFVGNATPSGFVDSTDYVFSFLRRSTILAQIRGSYFFTPRLSLELYMEPYASSGHFYNYGTLAAPSSPDLVFHDSTSQTDNFNYFATRPDYGFRSFRSSMVLRWEFSPGSTAYFVWQRNMADDVDPGRDVRFKSLFDGFSGEGIDMVAIKLSYWIPVS